MIKATREFEPTIYDTYQCTLNKIPYPLYLYLIDSDRFNTIDEGILGNCPAIHSVQYVPFLDMFDVEGNVIDYDVERFGKTNPQISNNLIPKVYRLQYVSDTPKKIGEFPSHDTSEVEIGGRRKWQNESRLYNYPYAFAILTDYINTPLEIKYHLMKRTLTQSIYVRQTLSERCSYGLFLQGYKNDVDGRMESLVSGDAHELPCSSSAYSQWYSSSKNQTTATLTQNISKSFMTQRQQTAQNTLSGVGSVLGGITNLGTGGLINGGLGLANMYLSNSQLRESSTFDRSSAIKSAMAQQSDLMNTPNTLLSKGSDFVFGYVSGGKKVDIIRYGLSIEYAQKLGDYFAMYGYKQNKLMSINYKSRHYYNYIKTIGVNIKANGIPKAHLEEIKNIFNNGTTIWHVTNDNVTVGDYSMDNKEI